MVKINTKTKTKIKTEKEILEHPEESILDTEVQNMSEIDQSEEPIESPISNKTMTYQKSFEKVPTTT